MLARGVGTIFALAGTYSKIGGSIMKKDKLILSLRRFKERNKSKYSIKDRNLL
jgi:hypothetical protein